MKHIDISSNAFTSFDCLVNFLNLKEIILDNNYLSDKTLFPTKRFMSVELLSLNNNKVNIWFAKLSKFSTVLRMFEINVNVVFPLINYSFSETHHAFAMLSDKYLYYFPRFSFQFEQLEQVIAKLSWSFPNLMYLSLLGNSCCPFNVMNIYFNERDYMKYR